MTTTDIKRWRTILILSAIVILILIYGFFDPSTHFFPRCIFKSLTGLDCPGCGSQRALHALLHADIIAAWRFNAMLVLSIPPLAVMAAAAVMRTRYPGFYAAMISTKAIYIWLVAITLWWILRNAL